jgi:hypothetical protein
MRGDEMGKETIEITKIDWLGVAVISMLPVGIGLTFIAVDVSRTYFPNSLSFLIGIAVGVMYILMHNDFDIFKKYKVEADEVR